MVAKKESNPVIQQVFIERRQGHETRQKMFRDIERVLARPVVSFFTSFRYPVNIEDADADILEGILQKLDLSKGLALFISSPGGRGLAAERIINVCRKYSGTGEYWAVVPGKAKSAATMICFGASKLIMGATSELGTVDPQLPVKKEDTTRWYSAYNIVRSYDKLFKRAVAAKGNLQPYLQQLANYDERDIEEFRTALSLSEDIAVLSLASGMMKGLSQKSIRRKISMFLSPVATKTHGRPIFAQDALRCGLEVELKEVDEPSWLSVYELYIRTNEFVSTHAMKCIESSLHSFFVSAEDIRR